jgi:hypothetical protein
MHWNKPFFIKQNDSILRKQYIYNAKDKFFISATFFLKLNNIKL